MTSIPKYDPDAASDVSSSDFGSDESYYDEIEDMNAFPINEKE